MRLRKHLLTAITITMIVLSSASDSVATPVLPAFTPGWATGKLDRAGLRRVTQRSWRTYRAAAGAPTIRVSPALADPGGVAAQWSSFFGTLLHGAELALLDAYVAPIDEVRLVCGNDGVLGCYGENHLVIPDQPVDGIAATSVATHEYGHHVANNRLNPPWVAIDWGAKRWATAEHVCPRVSAGTAFPGAENADYPLNPGEAFAESYRFLNETASGLAPTWPIVDPSFRPDAADLEALRHDVLDPWTGPTSMTKRVTLAASTRTWTMRLATSADGSLHAQLQPGSDDMTLRAPATGELLARGAWSSSGAKTFDFNVCGQRSLLLRVSRHSTARRFTLRLSTP